MITHWTPEAWAAYCEANPSRKLKAERDRQLIVEMLGPSRGLRALEAGCGYGRLTPALTQSPLLIVLDRELKMVKSVCNAIGKNLRGVTGDLERLPFRPASFDTVICVGVLMHVRDALRAIDQLAQIVQPGGRLLLSWNNRWSAWCLPLSFWAHRPKGLRQTFIRKSTIVQYLRHRGFSVRSVRGDALIPLAAAFPGTDRSLWPLWWSRWMIRIERLPGGNRLLASQGYELFALAQREGIGHSDPRN